MFNNSHYLLFHFFSYIFLLLFAFFLPFLFIYVISYFWFSFSFFISISYYNCLICIFLLFFSFMFVFIVLLFLYSYYLFLLSFALFFLFFVFLIFTSIIKHYSIIHYSPHKLDLISWFLLVLLNIIPLFTIHQTNWIVSYHIDSIIKRKCVGICFDCLFFLCISLWFIYPLISFTISILANNRINHMHRFETTIQILQIIVKKTW